MNKLELIRSIIKKIPRGKIFFSESISTTWTPKNTNHLLSQLVKTGDIVRIRRGMYVRPRKSRYLQAYVITPNADEIVKAISKKTGEVISTYAAAALNYVGLSTQIQINPIYYTTGRSRDIKSNRKRIIKLKYINPKKLIMPNSITCLVATALWSQGKDSISPLSIKKIHHRIGEEDFFEVLKHLDKMPLWMKKVFVQYQNMQSDDPRLVEDLNSYYQG